MKRRLIRLHLRAARAICVLMIVSAPASGSNLAAMPADAAAAADPADWGAPSHSYHIAAGDVISITVWGHDQFSQRCQVNGSGTISYPLLGDIPAAGLTCLEFQAQLEEGLKQYLKRPQITVRIVEYGAAGGSVFVLGEVHAPGVYPVSSNMGLLQALAAAGGATDLASGEVTVVKARSGEIQRVGLETAFAGSPSTPDALIDPGDVIVVNRAADADRQRRYAVLGEVPSPGMYEIPPGREVSVLDALEKAGVLGRGSEEHAGSSPGGSDAPYGAADMEHALLTRGEVVVPLNLAALLRGDTSQDVMLQEGDVLTIPRRSLIAVYALGEVRAPGRQTLPPGSTVMSLLNAVGGVTSAAHLPDATILRATDGEPRPIQVDLGALLHRADRKYNVVLQEGDVLFVPTRGEKRSGILHLLPVIPYLLN